MARVNVYLPDDLAEKARAAGVNVSNVTQQALRQELGRRTTDDWVDRINRLSPARLPMARRSPRSMPPGTSSARRTLSGEGVGISG